MRPLISVPRSASITSSAAPSGTSTNENRSWISIDPTSRPDRLDSPVMAPTRSCGRIPAARPMPTNSRTALPEEARCGRPLAAAPRVPGRAAGARAGSGRASGMSCSSGSVPEPSCASLTAASATSMTSNSSVSASTTPRKPSRSPASSVSRSDALVSSSRRARRSATVGSVAMVIFWPVSRSIVLSMRCSRGSASVIATPSRPARPTRPMRWTYDSGAAGTL